LSQSQLSLSSSQFSDEEFRRFKQANTHVFKEKQVTESVISVIKDKIKNIKCIYHEFAMRLMLD